MTPENRKKILAMVRLKGLNVVADAVEIIDLVMEGTEPPIAVVVGILAHEQFDVTGLQRRAALTLALEALLSFDESMRARLAEADSE